MTGRQVLVLRPEPGASETAARLRAAGFAPVLMPLTEIRPLAPEFSAEAIRAACVAATSANALRHAPEILLGLLCAKPLFAVGEATAQAARDVGFETVTAGADDGKALTTLVLQDRPDGPLLYLCGSVRRPEFEAILKKADVEVIPVETYKAVPIDQSRAFARLATADESLVAMCHSPEAGRMLAGLIESHAGMTQRMRVVAISARAAQPLQAIGVAVDIARAPTDQAMLEALDWQRHSTTLFIRPNRP